MAYDIEIQVAASTDDIFVYTDAAVWQADNANERHHVGSWGTNEHKSGGGVRFLNVTIPQGATIDQAFLSICCRTSDSHVVINSRITGEDTDDAATFSDLADYQARRGIVAGGANDDNITTAQVDWDAIPAWTAGEWYNSPDIKTIIKEIVDRVGWASGQDMVLFWDDHAGRTDLVAEHVRRGRSYDFAGNVTGPKLYIDYTAATHYEEITSCGLTASAIIDRDVDWDRGMSPGLTIAVPAIGRALAFDRVVSAGLTASATIGRALAYIRASISNLTVSATVVKSWGRSIATNTAVAISTTITRALAYDRATSPGLTVSATVARSRNRTIATTANLTINAVISRAMAFTRAASPGLTVAVSIVRSMNRTIAAATNLTVDTVVAKAVSYARAIQPALTVAVSVVRAVAWDRAVNPGLVAAVTIARAVTWDRAISAGLTVAVTIARAVTWIRATTSNLTASVTVVRTIAWDRAVSVGLTISTTILRLLAVTRTVPVNLVVSVTIRYCGWLKKLLRIAIGRLDIKRIPMSRIPFYRRIRSCFE